MLHECKVKKSNFCEAKLKGTAFESCAGEVMLNMASMGWIKLAHWREGRSYFVN
jgi:hypothetical protein